MGGVRHGHSGDGFDLISRLGLSRGRHCGDVLIEVINHCMEVRDEEDSLFFIGSREASSRDRDGYHSYCGAYEYSRGY